MDRKESSLTRRDTGLVKSRPRSLADSYRVLESTKHVRLWFDKLKQTILARIELERRNGTLENPVFKEAGTLDDGSPYLYLKPVNRKGWLFEAKGGGWNISRAEKIGGRDFFLRNARDMWDRVLLLHSDEAERPLRVSSEQFSQDYLVYSFYEKEFCDDFVRRLSEDE